MITINVPVQEFKNDWELYESEKDSYYNKKTGVVGLVKYEDENYFVIETTNIKVRVEKIW
jgi:hypothetical protein